jgi:hypothetical protein
MMFKRMWFLTLLALVMLVAPAPFLYGQLDQGTVTGVVQDSAGAVIANAAVTLTNVDEGRVLKSTTDSSGVFTFSPVKIGNYKVSATAPNFETTSQSNLHLSIQQRLSVTLALKPGATTETVMVTTEAPLMQTDEASVGQTMDSETINNVPLNGRNWVYIAQLAAGVAPPSGSRGAGSGDFNANGQRAEENNFILDGVDNNANVVDFFNGASYVANPPPDALAEFNVQTSSYSAEFGHSAGAVVNASIKSGSNSFHGSLWEYVRNTIFDLHQWNDSPTLPVPTYHQNLFGATFGGPVLKNKIFLFGDAQANRIVYNATQLINVPTALERQGDFSELLNGSLTGASPIQLYAQSANAANPIKNNCLAGAGTSACPTGSGVPGVVLDPVAQKILNDYPVANTGNGSLYNNYTSVLPTISNTFQWDLRADWTIGSKDSTYSRFSYNNAVGENTPPLGATLDGGGFGDGKNKTLGDNFMWSETHSFSQTLVNEARFGFNYLHTGFQQPNAANAGFAASVGFGGIPTGTLNGGLPNVSFSGSAAPHSFGAPTWAATDEHNNVYEIIDNLTKIAGNHTLKAGVTYQNMRFSTLQPQESRGTYSFNGNGTSNPGAANTGYGLADFLLNQVNNAQLSNAVTNGDQRANFSVYLQDDWRFSRQFTFNLGVRYEYFQSYQDVGGGQASFNFLSKPTFNAATGKGSVTGQYLIPTEGKAYAVPIIAANGFDKSLAADGINIVYDSNPRLQTSQTLNFAPRLGLAWSPDAKTSVRAGFGIFYGGLESLGYWGNLGENYPFQFSAGFTSASCTSTMCPSLASNPAYGLTVENGFNTILKNGFASVVTGLSMRGTDAAAKTPYTEDWNLSLERSLSNDLVATASYVANTSRHLEINIDPNQPMALENPSANTQAAHPMPDFGGSAYTGFGGMSDYNSLQVKLEKRMSHGYNLLATYTWSHALDDAPTPLGSSDDGGFRQDNLIPVSKDYSNAGFDVRQRLTFNALYQLPFGKGRAYLNQNAVTDVIFGGWSANATFFAQTGEHFTVKPSGLSTAGGFENGPFAIQTAGEFATGGTSTSGGACATSVKTRAHWYNPCSYSNPWDAGSTTVGGAANPHYIPKNATDANTPVGDTTPVYVQDPSMVLGYAGGVRDNAVGPGYQRVNMSIFKDFSTFHEEKLTFRADIFNVFNTPSLGLPNTTDNSTNGGQITGPRSIQNNAPDSRFFQLSLKYAF